MLMFVFRMWEELFFQFATLRNAVVSVAVCGALSSFVRLLNWAEALKMETLGLCFFRNVGIYWRGCMAPKPGRTSSHFSFIIQSLETIVRAENSVVK